jgi:hypothetical protein
LSSFRRGPASWSFTFALSLSLTLSSNVLLLSTRAGSLSIACLSLKNYWASFSILESILDSCC